MNSQVKRITARCGRAGKRLFLGKGRFLFLKKRNKRRCGGGCYFEERRLPARSAQGTKNGRFTYEPSVLCNTLSKAAGARKRNSPALDFLLRGRFARESWRAGAADTGRDKAEEGGIPAVVFRPTTTQDVPASVRLRGCASRASRPVFSSKKKRRRPSEGLRFPRKPIGFSF